MIMKMMLVGTVGVGFTVFDWEWCVLFPRARAGTVIGICCNIACLLAILLKPYMPVTADILKEQLQAPDDVWIIVPEFTVLLPSGHKLGKVRSMELPRHFVLTCKSLPIIKVAL